MRSLGGLFLFSAAALAMGPSRNVSIDVTSSDIVYSPFLCNSSITATSTSCDGAWRTEDLNGSTVVFTDGMSSQTGGIIPQMFMTLQASAIFFRTSGISNATVNIVVSAGGLVVTTQVNSAAGLVAIVDLIENDVTTISITFVPGSSPSRFDIRSIEAATANETSSPFIPPSVPTPTPPPPASPTNSANGDSTSKSTKSGHKKLAEGLGLVLGLGLGLTLVAAACYFLWNRRPPRWRDSEPPTPPAAVTEQTREVRDAGP